MICGRLLLKYCHCEEKLREIRNNADYDWIDKDFLYYKTNMSIVKNKSKKALESLEALKNYPPYDYVILWKENYNTLKI